MPFSMRRSSRTGCSLGGPSSPSFTETSKLKGSLLFSTLIWVCTTLQGLVEGYLMVAAQQSSLFAHILIWQLQVTFCAVHFLGSSLETTLCIRYYGWVSTSEVDLLADRVRSLHLRKIGWKRRSLQLLRYSLVAKNIIRGHCILISGGLHE